MMPDFFAYCWRTGLIEFGSVLPDGALEITSASQHDRVTVIDRVAVRARHGWDNSLFVPGVPEATSDAEAFAAFQKWRSWGDVSGRIEWQVSDTPNCGVGNT
ncbi:MAG: host nuclease inhibitor protein [Pseudomonadota bacterium]